MKYLKTTVYEFILILIFTLIYTILYYFNITSTSFNNALKIISFILIFVLTGIRIGRLSNKKGWLEGLKMALITIVIFLDRKSTRLNSSHTRPSRMPSSA